MGCPMGSVLLGNAAFIKSARRIRKKLGGGLRQAGYMAATGLYAMEHHIARLAEDHHHAKQIAKYLLQKTFVGHMLPVETNILIFEVQDAWTPRRFTDYLKKENILAMPISDTQVRIVTHLDITQEMVERTCAVISQME
jgi:threonine aldolase